MLSFKPGVSIYGLQPEILWAIDQIVEVWPVGVVITSARGDVHSMKSRHYSGLAVDIRTRGISGINAAVERVSDVLGKDYDVILESNHLHVEYDPKNAFNYPTVTV